MHILLVEDDTVLADALASGFRHAGHAVHGVEDGAHADHALTSGAYDLVVLDLQLPSMDGFSILRRMRGRHDRTPVLILTARDALDDRVRGLDLGADDYVTKPFDFPEVEARVRALQRRMESAAGESIEVGRLKLDTVGRVGSVDGELLDLSRREYAVLEFLVLRSGRVVTKEKLIQAVYGWSEEVGTNAIEVNVHRIRKKIAHANVSIMTVRGLGYLLSADATASA